MADFDNRTIDLVVKERRGSDGREEKRRVVGKNGRVRRGTRRRGWRRWDGKGETGTPLRQREKKAARTRRRRTQVSGRKRTPPFNRAYTYLTMEKLERKKRYHVQGNRR